MVVPATIDNTCVAAIDSEYRTHTKVYRQAWCTLYRRDNYIYVSTSSIDLFQVYSPGGFRLYGGAITKMRYEDSDTENQTKAGLIQCWIYFQNKPKGDHWSLVVLVSPSTSRIQIST
jgi:hypothetical protein